MRIAINGMGRIGRATFRQILESPEFDLVAVNDLVPLDNIVYLINFDTVYGRYDAKVESDVNGLKTEKGNILAFGEKKPSELPWSDLGVELVFDCTGKFLKLDDLSGHLQSGVQAVILSAPAKDDSIPTVVYGVNHESVGRCDIVSCASCTTNCIAPVVEVLSRRVGIRKATLTTIHAYTSTQSIVDGPNMKMRRGRAGAVNYVPTSTGAAKATAKALPQFLDKFDGVAVRGPVPSGSLADLVFLVDRATRVEEVNRIFEEEAATERYRDILVVTADPVVSSDIIGQNNASIVDSGMTQVVDGDLVKIMSWYDNEWGYAGQMVREALYLSSHS